MYNFYEQQQHDNDNGKMANDEILNLLGFFMTTIIIIIILLECILKLSSSHCRYRYIFYSVSTYSHVIVINDFIAPYNCRLTDSQKEPGINVNSDSDGIVN